MSDPAPHPPSGDGGFELAFIEPKRRIKFVAMSQEAYDALTARLVTADCAALTEERDRLRGALEQIVGITEHIVTRTEGRTPVTAMEHIDGLARAREELELQIDAMLADFQRACERVVVRGDSHLPETTKHRMILRNELRSRLLAVATVEREAARWREASYRLANALNQLRSGTVIGRGEGDWRICSRAGDRYELSYQTAVAAIQGVTLDGRLDDDIDEALAARAVEARTTEGESR